jgi:hypothetical protein
LKEQINKYEETINDDTSPMNIEILGSSIEIPLTGGHELGLVFFTPSKAHKVSNMNTFRFNKASRKIVKQHTRKLPVTGKDSVLVTTKTTMKENVIKDLLSITSAGIGEKYKKLDPRG